MLGSLHISLYSHLSHIPDFVSPCGFIPKILLAAFEMQISCLVTDHDLRIYSTNKHVVSYTPTTEPFWSTNNCAKVRWSVVSHMKRGHIM